MALHAEILQKSLQITHILMTGVDCVSHQAFTHTQDSSCNCLYSLCTYLHQLQWCGTAPQARGEFWINRARKRRGSSHKQKEWKIWQIKFINSYYHLLQIHACTFSWEIVCLIKFTYHPASVMSIFKVINIMPALVSNAMHQFKVQACVIRL